MKFWRELFPDEARVGALLKLLEAHLEGDPAKAEETYERYEVGINEYSATSGISASTLDAAVRRKSVLSRSPGKIHILAPHGVGRMLWQDRSRTHMLTDELENVFPVAEQNPRLQTASQNLFR